MSDASTRVYVAAFTRSYLFQGMVVTGERRLSDLLNDRRIASLTVGEARVYNLARPEKPIFAGQEILLKKQRLVAVAILKEEAHLKAQPGHAVERTQARPALLILHSYEVQGQLHLHGSQDSAALLAWEGRWFFPVTDATLMATFNPKVRISADTILVREAMVDGLCLTAPEMSLALADGHG